MPERAPAKSSGLKSLGAVRRYLAWSLASGLAMGLAFPAYASLFVTFNSGDSRLVFTLGCAAAGLLVGLVAFLIGELTILAVARDLTRRLDALAEHGADLGAGMPEGRQDTMGRLVSSFNRVLSSLAVTVGSLDEVAERTKQVGFELAANSTETSAASEEIARHMEAIHEQTDILVQEIDNVHMAHGQISVSAQEVSDAINRQSDSLTRLSSVVEGTVEDVRSIAEATGTEARTIARSIARSSESLSGLEEVSRKVREIEGGVGAIGELTQAIDEIADRITILGMNAAIEAAHAGEAGRGFAVVADEIGKLSEMAAANAAGIEEGLKAVSAQVEEGVGLSRASQEGLASLFRDIDASAASIAEMARRFDGLITRTESMLAAHNDLVKVTIEVTDSMVGMRDSTDTIEDSVTTLQASADTYTLAVDEVSRGIHEIAVDVAHLHTVSTINSDNTEALRAAIGRFRARDGGN